VARLPWDDAFAPAGWDKAKFADYNGGEPDVVMMEYDPAYVPEMPSAKAAEKSDNPKRKKASEYMFVDGQPEVIDMQKRRLLDQVMRDMEAGEQEQKEAIDAGLSRIREAADNAPPAVDDMGDPVAAFRRVAGDSRVNNSLYDELDFLQPDMTTDEFMDALSEQQVSAATRRLMRALDKDDWLGFDSPSQAINAIMTEDINQFDISAALKSAMGRYANSLLD
jgi:hypothetical protein